VVRDFEPPQDSLIAQGLNSQRVGLIGTSVHTVTDHVVTPLDFSHAEPTLRTWFKATDVLRWPVRQQGLSIPFTAIVHHELTRGRPVPIYVLAQISGMSTKYP